MKPLLAILFAILPVSTANAVVAWNSADADRDSRHAVFFDVGVEIPQGVRLEKDTRAGKAEYYLSIVVGDKPRRRMPISKKIFTDRYESLRSLTIATDSSYPSEDCRVRFRVIKSSESDPAWMKSICDVTLTEAQRAKMNAWYKKTLGLIQNSRF